MTWAEVCARRLERHGLSEPADAERLAEQARVMCGVHAQIMSAAELSLGLRVAGLTRSDVRKALWNDHHLIKTYGPRGTVHLLRAEDLSMWTGALPAIPATRATEGSHAILTPEQVNTVVDAIAEILADTELTADELTEALVATVGSWAGEPVMPAFQGMWPRWRDAMTVAAHRGALCFGPNRGRYVTYTNPRRWLPEFRPADAKNALAGLARNYLHAYGPATPHQFAQWLAAPRQWATALFDSLTTELEQVDIDGVIAWQNAGDGKPANTATGVRLLPYFDAYVVGCHPREKLYPGRAAERALRAGQAGNFPVLLIDGLVAGVWHQRRSGKRFDITVEPLDELTAVQRDSLDREVERVGCILEATPSLTIGTVTVGPHA